MSDLSRVGNSIAPPILHRMSDAPALLVRTMDGRITLWSPAMTKRYGFTADQARGQQAHQLLGTMHWKPLHEVATLLLEQKFWCGGLIHHKSDGRPMMTAHQWHLHVDVTGGESLVTELHSDIVPVGETKAEQFADVMEIVVRELSQPMTAIADYVSAIHHIEQTALPNRQRVTESLSAAAVQIDRLKQERARFHALAEALRDVSSISAVQTTPQQSAAANE